MITGIIRDRRLDFDVPAEWPDGTRVEIFALDESAENERSPEQIQATLAAMDAIKPSDISDAEHAKWDAERREQKDREKAVFFNRAEQLRRYWE
jgi:hypothetical protein